MHKKALLIISFGSSCKTERKTFKETVDNIFREKFRDYDFFTAYSSRNVIKEAKEKDGISIDTPTEALLKIKGLGYDEVICQSLHIINGIEYDITYNEVKKFKKTFKNISLGKPLLTYKSDYIDVINSIIKISPALKENESLLLMGHGSNHSENSAYLKLDYLFKRKGYDKIFVGTLEGFPKILDVIEHIKEKNINKIYLMPFMITAGNHFRSMAVSENNSWKSILINEGYEVEVVLKRLYESKEIINIFATHSLNNKINLSDYTNENIINTRQININPFNINYSGRCYN